MRPGQAVVICASPRTGSGLLCSALWSTGQCGRPDEYLDEGTRRDYEAMWRIHGDREYAEQVLRHGTTDNGVFAMKVHWHQLAHASWLTGNEPLAALADRVDFCVVRRRDPVRQAVSAYVAELTGRYTHRVLDGASPPVDVPFDADRIGECLAEVQAGERHWFEYFADLGVEPVHVWYEDDLEASYAETTRRLLAIFGVDASPDLQVTVELEKQADTRTEALVTQFRVLQT